MIDLLMDLKGWDVNINNLPSPQREKAPYLCCFDQIFESDDKSIACIFYTIFEYRSDFNTGLIAIYKNKDNPELILNAENTWFEFTGLNSVIFSSNNKYLFLRKICYNYKLANPDIPFCIIDIINHKFSFIEFDYTSLQYTLKERYDSGFEIVLIHENDQIINHKNRNGEPVDLLRLPWFDLSKISNFCSIYWDNL